MQIAGRAFLITGGGSGLGAACARQIVAAGGRVVIADLNRATGEALAAQLGEQARFALADVTDVAAVSQAIETAINAFGELHGAIHCAGIIAGGRVLGKEGPHDLALFARVVEVNLIGTFNVLRLAGAAIACATPDEQGERGVIVNTSSVAAFEGQIGQCAYAASKGGVAALTLPAARELARHGIRVVAIAPGIFDTPMMGQVSAEIRDSLTGQIPFPARFGRPEEFAALAQHIIENRFLNGEVIRLDGAVRMGAK